MLALNTMQQTVAAAIAAHTFFATAPAVSCIVDDGTQHSAIEAQLRGVGFVVVIPPIFSADRHSPPDGAGKMILTADVTVRLLSNPVQNAAVGGANRNIYSAMSAATAALLALKPGLGDRKFGPAVNFIQLAPVDEGLLGYDLTFNKLSTL